MLSGQMSSFSEKQTHYHFWKLSFLVISKKSDEVSQKVMKTQRRTKTLTRFFWHQHPGSKPSPSDRSTGLLSLHVVTHLNPDEIAISGSQWLRPPLRLLVVVTCQQTSKNVFWLPGKHKKSSTWFSAHVGYPPYCCKRCIMGCFEQKGRKSSIQTEQEVMRLFSLFWI